MLSIYDLTFHYIQRFYSEEPTPIEKREVLQQFEDLFAFGWTMKDINRTIRQFVSDHPDQRPELSTLFASAYRREENLLRPSTFYYHNQIRVTPGPPKRHLDIDSGEIKKIDEPYYLEMRASYTIEELSDYYIRQFGLKGGSQARKRVIGGFKHLLKTHDVESLLFMIDVASNTVYSEDMDKTTFNVFKLPDYQTLAESQLGEKRTENIISGDDRIVPRKRVLSFRRSGSI